MFNRPSVIDDMQRVVAPLQALLMSVAAKVDTLSADHVTRQDMATMRKEMSDGFAALDDRFIRRDIGDARYTELKNRDDKQEERIEALETLLGTSNTAASQRYIQINERILTITLTVFGGLFIALVGYILYHLPVK